jgi:hypothetical protein
MSGNDNLQVVASRRLLSEIFHPKSPPITALSANFMMCVRTGVVSSRFPLTDIFDS